MRERHRHRARAASTVLAIAIGMAAGCGPSVVRKPVPIGAEDRPQLPAIPDGVRAWGHAFSPALQKSLADSVGPCVRAYDDKYPTAGLAISGGGSDGAFGAGLLCGRTAHGDRPTFRLVFGVSAGAILARFAFLGHRDGR